MLTFVRLLRFSHSLPLHILQARDFLGKTHHGKIVLSLFYDERG